MAMAALRAFSAFPGLALQVVVALAFVAFVLLAAGTAAFVGFLLFDCFAGGWEG